jgi:hypothetical protein
MLFGEKSSDVLKNIQSPTCRAEEYARQETSIKQKANKVSFFLGLLLSTKNKGNLFLQMYDDLQQTTSQKTELLTDTVGEIQF